MTIPSSVTDRYDYRTSAYLEALLDGRDRDDPLVRQFVPDERELLGAEHERADPIGDRTFSPVPGIVHRHPNRVLLKVAHACPVYCRFCFRREMIGRHGEPLSPAALEAALAYIGAHPEIEEVILTGGDPLVLSGRRLSAIFRALAEIPHIAFLRVHTRVPIVAPAMLADAALEALRIAMPLYVAVHVNHPDELTPEAIAALQRLRRTGVELLSQTVLLKGVNDDAQVLARLFTALVRQRVRPYYLHHPDLAAGTAHFRVPIEVGQQIMRQLRRTVSGICLPTYVLDIPGGFGKVPIGPVHAGTLEPAAGRQVIDIQGVAHHYPE